ncbi:glycoside hydrolase family 28 protein [Selenomonas montiformis]|uniref:glycoside hydrolase family 28 protein n=1 Tax=Selenomonas montiformis TaxID=2652285 RepID=UPI0039F5A8C8
MTAHQKHRRGRQLLAAVLAMAVLALAGSVPAQAEADIERQAAAITASLCLPQIPQDRIYRVTDYGAVPDDRRDDRPAFQQALDHAAQKGGVVLVPSGHFYLAGPLTLRSHVELRLDDGAVLDFSHRPDDYAGKLVLTRFECTECYNYSPFLYVYGGEDIAVTGSGSPQQGVIDGHGDAWWPWVGAGLWKGSYPNQQQASSELKEMGNDDVPVEQRIFGRGHYLRPVLIQPYASKRVLIRGIRVKNSPMYHINPVLCEDVMVDHVAIEASGPNTDGVDPDACRNVWIKDSFFQTGDDCIAIKAGRDNDGRRVGRPSQRIVIERNVFRGGHGGVTMGSEMAGGISQVYSLHNVMDSPDLRWAYRLKTNSRRGGGVEGFWAFGDEIRRVSRAVLTVDMAYDGGDIGEYTPDIHGLHLENLTVDACRTPLADIRTYARNPVYDFTWKDCVVRRAGSSGGRVFRLEETPAENIHLTGMQINGKACDGAADF